MRPTFFGPDNVDLILDTDPTTFPKGYPLAEGSRERLRSSSQAGLDETLGTPHRRDVRRLGPGQAGRPTYHGCMASMGQQLARVPDRFAGVDTAIRGFLGSVGFIALRMSVGLVFVWFGLLKVLDVSPVADLVARTVYWFDPDIVVPALGVFEVAVGVLLLLNRWLRLALALFAGQMLGTFLVFVILPDVAFRHGNPLLLTVEGEFVVKNLVLLAAGMVVGSRVSPIAGRAASSRKAG